MSRKFAIAAAVALALPFAAGTALPVFAQEYELQPSDLIGSPAVPPVYFDLGVNATELPQDTLGARKYYAIQTADTQRVWLAACDNFMKHPADAEMPQTLVFCAAIIG